MQRVLLLAAALLVFGGCETMGGPKSDATADSENTTTPTSTLPGGGTVSVDPTSVEIAVGEPSEEEPVAWGVAVEPKQVAAGGTVSLVLRAKLFQPWHIYASEGPTGVGIPTQLELELPDGISYGSWVLPEAHVEESPIGPMALYEDDVRFAIDLQVGETVAPGDQKIGVTVKYQACNETQCLPPKTEQLETIFTVAAP